MKTFKIGVASSTIHAAGLGIRLVFMLALAKWTSPTVIGLYSLAVSIEAVVIYLAGLEFHTFTARRYAMSGQRSKLRLLTSSHTRLLVIEAPMAALIGTISSITFSLTRDPTSLFAIALLMCAGTIAQELGRYLVLARLPVQSVILTLLRTAAWQPLTLPFLNDDAQHNLKIIIYLWASSTILGVIWAGFILRDLWWPPAPFKRMYILRGIKQSFPYYGIASLSVIQSNIERFILQLLLGPSALGIYSFYQTLSNTLTTLVQTATLNIELPNILTKFGQRKTDRFDYLSDLRRKVFQICLVFSAIICCSSIAIIEFLSKPHYTSKFWILPILIFAQIMMAWTQPIHLALYAARHDRLLVGLMGITLAINLILDFVFISWLGLGGAVLAPLLTCGLVALYRCRLMKKLRRGGEL